MKKGVTMREIGAALGVSTVTISKALSGKDGVSDAVREKIIKTAQQMGYHYVPPAGAAEEASRQDAIVGILTPDRFFSSASFYASLYKELMRQMVEVGMLGVLEIVTDEQETALSAPMIVACCRSAARSPAISWLFSSSFRCPEASFASEMDFVAKMTWVSLPSSARFASMKKHCRQFPSPSPSTVLR